MLDGKSSPTEEDLLAEMADLSAEEAPRRFALCTVDVEQDDGVVLALPDEAIAYMYGETDVSMSILRATAATRFPRMLRRAGNVRLIWVDAETSVP